MNIKKILILGLILIAASTLVSTISAEDINELTINDIQFKIPDGFTAYENDLESTETDTDDGEVDTEDIDGTVVDSKITNEYVNGNQKLEITVGILANGQKIESINPAGFEQKTIAGKDGFFKKDIDDGVNQFKFEYLEDGKLVKIQAPSEEMISQIIA